jgi:hypothetical protein
VVDDSSSILGRVLTDHKPMGQLPQDPTSRNYPLKLRLETTIDSFTRKCPVKIENLGVQLCITIQCTDLKEYYLSR